MSTQRKKSAPVRSILLTKQMRGTLYLLAWRQTSRSGARRRRRRQDRDRAVEDAQGALDLDREVDVARVSMMLMRCPFSRRSWRPR